MELIQKITEIVKPILEESQCYLDEIIYEMENNEWYLRIFVEKINSSLDMETCVIVSEKISEAMDLHDPIKGEYYLEVSSPGAEKPLRDLEQVSKSIGKYIYIKLSNPIKGLGDDELYGTIISVENQDILVEYMAKNIKKKIVVEYDQIKNIRLAVKF